MKKLWAVICTIAFSGFWIFGALALLAWFDSQAAMPVFIGLSLGGLGLGLFARMRLVALTQDFARGKRVAQPEVA